MDIDIHSLLFCVNKTLYERKFVVSVSNYHLATNETTHNYRYDAIGQLVQDKTEEIENIAWTVTGKVKKIERYAFSERPDLEFDYDPMGQRITKIVYPKSAPGVIDVDGIEKMYYIRDAQGNVMTVYTLKAEDGETNLYLTERNLYGSSMLGIEKVEEVIASTESNNVGINTQQQRVVGDKRFYMQNHLGNVLATVTDRKLPEFDLEEGLTYYKPDVVSYSDYSPFGVTWRDGGETAKFGFNGKESDDEVMGIKNGYNYGFRMYDSRIARFLSIDPLTNKFPFYSPYQFAGNKPTIAIDLEGMEEFIVIGEPGTNIAANNTSAANVRAALQGQSAKNGAADLSNVQQVPNGQIVNVQSAIILWDPTARGRGQGGMIQFQNVEGIGDQMRGLTAQEKADGYISARLSIKGGFDKDGNPVGSIDFVRIIEGMEDRTDSQGDGVNENTSMSQGNSSAQLSSNGGLVGEAPKFIIITPPRNGNMNTRFNGGQAVILNPAQVSRQLTPLANILSNRSGATITLLGNTSGGTTAIPSSPSSNPTMTQGQLAIARATAVGNMLVSMFGVNPQRIQVAIGNVRGANGMSVQGQINIQGAAPNNGNRIDLE